MKSTHSHPYRSPLLLLLTALIWGLAFVAQDVAMNSMPPFTFNGIRMALGGLALMPCIFFLSRHTQSKNNTPTVRAIRSLNRAQRKTLFTGGFFCGLALFLGSSFQQIGILYTTAGKAGFITALYIVLVPLTGLFLGKRVRIHVWLAVGLSLAGLFLLCVTDSLSIGAGDLCLVLCALCFTCHILVIDYFSPRTDCLRMSCIQFFVASAFSLLTAVFAEQPTWSGIQAAWVPILYAGILSSAVGYTLQIIAQRNTDPTIASLILCLESVFAVLAGWFLLGDALSPRELFGCIIMLAGIVLAQAPSKNEKKKL